MKKVARFLPVMMISLVLLGGLLLPSRSLAEDQERQVVYHCDYGDAGRVDAMLRNIYNLVDYYTINNIAYNVDVVSNSACVQFLLKDVKGTKFEGKKIPRKVAKSIRLRMRSLAEGYGVRFEQCAITLQRTHIDKKKLKSFVHTTPSGQVRLVELQDRGYAYIKVK